MQEVDGEAFEGVSVRHRPPHCVLELLVATGDAGAALQLIGRQRRGQQVGQVVVPHCRQLQVLEEREHNSEINIMILFNLTSFKWHI